MVRAISRGWSIPMLIVSLVLLSWTASYPYNLLYRSTCSCLRTCQYDDSVQRAVGSIVQLGRYGHSKLINHVYAAVTVIESYGNSASSAADVDADVKQCYDRIDDILLPSVAAVVATTNTSITSTKSSNALQRSSSHSLKVKIQWFQSHIRRNNIQSLISLFKQYRDEVDITYHNSIDEYYISPDDISYALTRLLPSMNRGLISVLCEQVLFRDSSSVHVLDTQALTATMSSLNK